jgi:hypothetical protein
MALHRRSSEVEVRVSNTIEGGAMMCGRSYAARGAAVGVARKGQTRHGGRREFLGLDVEKIGPRAQVVAALSVLAPVVLSGIFLVAFVPGLWWIFTTYGWVAFPAFGLMVRGLAGLAEAGPEEIPAEAKERELLRALREHGELTPARAAMETSLSVAEADGMLKGLAEAGHLEVRVRGGGLYYALWRAEIGALS